MMFLFVVLLSTTIKSRGFLKVNTIPHSRRRLRGGAQDEFDTSLDSSPSRYTKELNDELFKIGGPAFIQLTAEPLASLIDTAYLGRLGPSVLGGAGIAIAAQYSVSKLYNDPLLRTSTSLVASESQSSSKAQMSASVSSALLLASVVGLLQAVIYFAFTEQIIGFMGITAASSMHYSAVSYLKVRALGTPAATVWLVSNGIFRGLGDTRTPLKWSIIFTVLNAILDPLFIFTLNLGASGAAAGTALAQTFSLFFLLRSLNNKVEIRMLEQLTNLGDSLKSYLSAASIVFLRTVGKVAVYAFCAKQAALLGAVGAAAYNLTFQLGFATTQICESVAIAVQTLIARELKSKSPEFEKKRNLKHLTWTAIKAGGAISTSLSFLTYLFQSNVISSLTSDLSIQSAALSIFPVVLVTQVLKGLAYPVNGITMGALDWKFSAYSMWGADICAIIYLVVQKSNGQLTLFQLWIGLAIFMGVQVVSGLARIRSKTGVWKILADE